MRGLADRRHGSHPELALRTYGKAHQPGHGAHNPTLVVRPDGRAKPPNDDRTEPLTHALNGQSGQIVQVNES